MSRLLGIDSERFLSKQQWQISVSVYGMRVNPPRSSHLAANILASLQTQQNILVMHRVRTGDVNDVHIGILDQILVRAVRFGFRRTTSILLELFCLFN